MLVSDISMPLCLNAIVGLPQNKPSLKDPPCGFLPAECLPASQWVVYTGFLQVFLKREFCSASKHEQKQLSHDPTNK